MLVNDAQADFRKFERIERAHAHARAAQIAFIVIDLNHDIPKLNVFQCLPDIGDQILAVLTSDRKPDESVRQT